MKAILAVDSHWGIGRNGTIPWHLRMDMMHFSSYTMGNICLMGRTTYQSIPEQNHEKLPGRIKIVMSKNTTIPRFGEREWWANDWDMAGVELEALSKTKDRSDVILIGGLSLYRRLLQYCDEIMLTRIEEPFGCDVRFEDHFIDALFGDDDQPGIFEKSKRIATIEECINTSPFPTRYHIEKYRRINPLEIDKVPDDLRPVVFPNRVAHWFPSLH